MFAKSEQRHLMVLLSALAVFICYIAQINMSVAIIPLAEEFGWGPQMQGAGRRAIIFFRRLSLATNCRWHTRRSLWCKSGSRHRRIALVPVHYFNAARSILWSRYFDPQPYIDGHG